MIVLAKMLPHLAGYFGCFFKWIFLGGSLALFYNLLTVVST